MHISEIGRLANSITYVKGVGPAKSELLEKEKGIVNQWDMLMEFPFRYIDRRSFNLIQEPVEEGQIVQYKGKILNVIVQGESRKRRLTAEFTDGTGTITLIWFQGVSRLEKLIRNGERIIVFGRLSIYNRKRTIAHPEIEILDDQSGERKSKGLQPVYSSTEKLNSKGLDTKGIRRITYNLIADLREHDVYESLPNYLLQKLKLISRYKAFKWIHFPPDHAELKQAQTRLIFEELFTLQLQMLFRMKSRKAKFKGLSFEKVGNYFLQFYNQELPFELTGAQKKVLREIRADTKSGVQMNRLVQGDVGSGKTIVAVMAILLAIDNGYQACLMAPTEILATQHYLKIEQQLKNIGLKAAYLSGSVKGKKRKLILEELERGEIHLLIGTHAIIEEWVKFKSLGLSITDEQHRFGVEQRAKLWKKSGDTPPHVMVMTATPIPRTLAMTLYGDLDISVIDELPPGRKAVKTTTTYDKYRGRLNQFLKSEIAKGRQIYVVYPLIEESSKLDLANLQEGYERLLEQFPRPDYQIGVVHGKMKPEDKEMEMQKFAQGRTNILVSTTVIEVGVNVPNASVMVIENAERFGLSQLHQLRGRVGRGAEQSHCILLTGYKLTKVARKRMEIMCSTNNGFVIAEEDLKLRGPGEIEGTKQSGDLNLRMANLARDGHILKTARDLARAILDKDPELQHPENLLLRKLIERQSGNNLLNRIG
ncbi:MAG: ATP-dependent DNA helicase RecG [Saprospirales bacterium]|nr:MAG: ATP-dependent DNA helicase RecG [Saprospirales bacterium]